MTIATRRWFALSFSVSLGLLVGCSPSPAAVGDGGPDAMASPDVVVVSDASPVTDVTGSVTPADAQADSGPSTGPRCGLAGASCAAGQVCCASSGPDSPERCVAADACTLVRCDATEHCAAGSFCCTDGIQSTCSRTERCGNRACRTAADCLEGQMCTPFGQTRVCR
jgi:hypothetical protein